MKQKGSAITAILIIIAVILIGAGSYWAGNNGLFKDLISKQTPLPTTSSTPQPSQTPKVESNVLNISGNLQDLMKNNCVQGNPPTLDQAKLPVNIDFAAAKIVKKAIYCVSTQDNTQPITNGYISILLSNNSPINIYDSQSQELGHGGAPFLGSVGQKISESGNVQITAYLQGGDGPQVLGQVGINIRGVKKFTTKDGNSIYINYTMQAVPGSDQRLIDQLKPYSSVDPNLGIGNEPAVNYDDAMKTKIINFFFNATPSSSSPEGQALQKVMSIMNSVTAI